MKSQNSFKKSLLPALISVLVLPICAQGAYGATTLEEIVVTARKRQESIQDVPVAVTALSPGQLERGSITSSLDLAKLAPNVQLHETAIGSESLSASIRGLSYDDIEKSIEPTVGVSIDGVFLASNSGGVFDMFDVESVEVLRGPQGTLFGRNTIGGVISVNRTQPTGEWGGKVEVTSGDENMTDVKAILNMPLGANGGIKIAVKDKQSDSHVYNTTLKMHRPMKDSETFTLSAKYNFTDNTSAQFTYDSYDHNTTAADNVFVATGFLASIGFGDGAIASEKNDWKTSPQLNPLTATLEGDNYTAKVTHTGENYEIKYIMGIMDYEEEVHESSWGINGVFFPVDRNQEFKQTSHEVQFISDFDGPMNVVAGVYMMEADSYITSGPAVQFTANHSVETTAVFGEISYDLSDVWSLTVGARYTEEDKDLDSRSWVTGSSNVPRLSNSRDPSLLLNAGTPSFNDDNISYRVVLQREFELGMMYASYSTGFRSGGFFNRGSTDSELAPFKSEEVESFELGMRSNPTDNSQLNLTYFMADYSDKQTTIITAGNDPVCGKADIPTAGVTCSFVRNAGQVSMQGLELEYVLMPTDELTLRATLGTLDTEIDEFDYNGLDISNKAHMLYAPELTAYLGAEHTSDLGGGTLTINAGWSYKDDMYTQADWSTYDPATGPETVIESYESLDLSATYLKDMGAGTLKVRLYGTDILEEGNRVSRRYDAGAFAWAELAARRQFGVTVGFEF
ncbi:MAG: iron complex outermembrane receptor protein [Porticoccaceae bacterium]|jgi:iron complex outermembrane receptor protein|tara:strand:+ start:334 stop:2547 length:2214 start_codon:yes stop_codon:yes gene_type:complete